MTRTLPAVEGTPLLVAVLTALVLVALAHHTWPDAVPLVTLVPPCLVATTLCPIREVRIVFGLVPGGEPILRAGGVHTKRLSAIFENGVVFLTKSERAHSPQYRDGLVSTLLR